MGIGWFVTAGFLALVASVLVTAGLWLYRGFLTAQITGYSETLTQVEGEFEPSLILELRRTARAIDVGRELLKNHIATSRLLKFIEDNTLAETNFSRFIYKEGIAVLSGSSRSYSLLAQQASVFEESPFVSRATFSDFALGSGGLINFRAELVIQPELITYQGD
jgi:hypothetical protein